MLVDKKIAVQKLVADKVLEKLELLDYRCIVAGGAARDWYLGKPATDLDVFLYAPQFTSASIRVETLNRLGFNITNSYENWKVNEIYKHNEYVAQLYNCVVDEEKVQIIFMSKPTYISVVDTFPLSISKAWYKNKTIKFSKEFEQSIKYKIIWKTVDSYSNTNKYILKILTKFSDYRYVTKPEATTIINAANKDDLIIELTKREEEKRKTIDVLNNYITDLESKYRELLILYRSINRLN